MAASGKLIVILVLAVVLMSVIPCEGKGALKELFGLLDFKEAFDHFKTSIQDVFAGFKKEGEGLFGG
ncbi:hypothetical protein NPIL_158791 [Nephila pilipes]|uniref:Uncharacterized protein n=1 Tax=Nephila pilipes TaxID=299642 RepID=A0A8X6QL82_NEPPI|nr:hypothetical protein NPIL_158791 [Nephila pilipes]